jgi:hypothetical protein
MAALGVVYGVGGSRFNPNGALTREQAAAILSRLAQVVGRPLPYGAASYADLGSAFDYAKAAIGQVQAAGVMEGVAAGYFSPKTAYTRAQSIATIWRLYNYVR